MPNIKMWYGIVSLEPPDDKPLDANDPAVKAMKESARQLGVDLEEE